MMKTNTTGGAARDRSKPMPGKKFVGAQIPASLHAEYGRLCRIAGRSMASDICIAIDVRTRELMRQEREGTIRGTRRI